MVNLYCNCGLNSCNICLLRKYGLKSGFNNGYNGANVGNGSEILVRGSWGCHPKPGPCPPRPCPPGPCPPPCPSCPTGPTGPQGYMGKVGQTGAAGATGPTGLQGYMGQVGQTGATGATGPAGAAGLGGLLYEFNAVLPYIFYLSTGANGATAWDPSTSTINPFPFPRDTTLSLVSDNGGSPYYDPTTSTYTAPVGGDYLFSTTILLANNSLDPPLPHQTLPDTAGLSTVSYLSTNIQFVETAPTGTPGPTVGQPAIPVHANYPTTYTLVTNPTNVGTGGFVNNGIDSHTITQIIPLMANESVNVALTIPQHTNGEIIAMSGSTFQGGLVASGPS